MIEKILVLKRAEVARMQAAPPLLPRRRAGGEVAAALQRRSGDPLRLIAEVKFRSPSAGPLSRALDAAGRALVYAGAGAAMISVLTDGPFFEGSFDDLARCRDALESALGSRRPRLLCKEFILHPVQLDRAVDAGADAALLIARIVSPRDLATLAAAARARGLEPLVEVATLDELAAAIEAEARVIGVNARDLNTLKMDPDRASAVLAAIPSSAVAVYLSGLATSADVTRVAAGPAAAALIGEALMRQDDPGDLLAAMTRAALAGA
jgi:indole-3-glycerol phosphate synthase